MEAIKRTQQTEVVERVGQLEAPADVSNCDLWRVV